MIAKLRGKVIEKGLTYIFLDVNGITFLLKIPLSTGREIKSEEVELFTHLEITEKGPELYGFLTKEEKEFFEDLIGIAGVGGAIALKVLSSFSYDEFKEIVLENKVYELKAIKGIGEKTALRIIADLTEKYKREVITDIEREAVKALCSMGVDRKKAREVIKKCKERKNLENLIKEALRML